MSAGRSVCAAQTSGPGAQETEKARIQIEVTPKS